MAVAFFFWAQLRFDVLDVLFLNVSNALKAMEFCRL
jgi:hypothetical protein